MYSGAALYSVGCYYIPFLGIPRPFKYDVI